MGDFENRIMQIIGSHPKGIKAKDIAQIMGCDRKDVNSALYGVLKGRCYQDSAYCWHLNSKGDGSGKGGTVITAAPDKRLSDLCRYYLNCLSLEERSGISAFLKSKFSLNYAELSSLSVDSSDETIAKLIAKVSADKKLSANLGYPVLIEKIHSSKTNQDYMLIAPVFLFTVEISGGAVSVSPIPHVNIEVIKKYSNRDINSQVYDLVELENELGLNLPDADIEPDELAARLQSIRDWQWRETLDPDNICRTPPVAEISEEGIYNRAIFIVTERPPYTVGLESELSQLSGLDEDSYKNTALYDWIHHAASSDKRIPPEDVPLLEVLPTNSEQEQAIMRAMSSRLTIVTGPPGTGKSQVVTNLLVNSAWAGKSVLFTSKNNKAVGVVDTRVNALGSSPIMLRIGGNQYAHHLAELIIDLLSYSADETDRQEYERYKALYAEKLGAYAELKKKKDAVVALRNRADHMEQKACELRGAWEKRFGSVTEAEADSAETVFNSYCEAYDGWHRAKSSFFGRLFWFATGSRKTAELVNRTAALSERLLKYDLCAEAASGEIPDTGAHKRLCAEGRQLTYALRTTAEYREAMQELLAGPQLEGLDRALLKVKSELSEIASQLWNKWLITRPLNIDADSRREMSEFVAAMRLVGGTDLSDYPDLNRKFKQLQKKMASLLPCWAVTSLSAKGRVPFRPGIFDLVVIDEASQCDIASALPMLYRAKRAVIIGGPKQLSHISTLSKKQDLSLLQKYGVGMGWSYSANSLYAMASGLTSPEQIVQLRDHHRSFGDIIEFSNAEFYDGRLRVATNYDRLRCPRNVEAGIRWVNVVGKTLRPPAGGAYNDAEAAAIVNEIRRLVTDNGYTGTVGVVTPFRAQAERIRSAIERNPELMSALAKNDFLVDTVHKFQGDERDLMFFSPVISQGTPQGTLGFLKKTGNLFNVAITRARAVLVVVGDFGCCLKC